MSHRRIAPLAALGVAAFVLLGASASAAVISSNWSGYVARTTARVKHFTRIVGVWTEPTATCVAGSSSYSAVWVGLGGYALHAKGLEQIGTDADCSRSGEATYSSWVELLPAASRALQVKVSAGDQIEASVTVDGRVATLRLTDLTSGAHASVVRPVKNLDVSSAEWIVEAPSVCTSATSCRTLTLADFGTATFSTATASSTAGTYSLLDGPWAMTELLLHQSQRAARGASSHAPGEFTLISATPSQVQTATGAFAVSWSEQQSGSEAPNGQSLPGLAGGSPP